MQGTKLPLTTWFLAIYLISQAKTGLSALALKRHLGVSYPTAWLIHHKLMQALADRERSEEHTSELQSLMRISYAVFCLQSTKYHYIYPTNRTSHHHTTLLPQY